ncbi:hypothetical protein SDC9_167031 [bioreactor metagenome]|uniref:Uncharacterized protein n=1 Tax=bioreactor metagenome TaxID=1076179 RepID=A0A645G1I3_9ZZZZ
MRNHDRFDRHRLAVLITDRNLTLGIGPQETVLFRLGFAQARQLFDDAMRIMNGRRHHFGRFVAGVTEHHPLVAGALFQEKPLPFGHPLGNIRRLFVHRHHDLGRVGRKADRRINITDVPHDIERDFLPVDLALGRDFTGNHDQIGRGQRFTGHPAFRIAGQTGIQNRVGNLIAHLIGMPFGNRFRSKDVRGADLAHNDTFLYSGLKTMIDRYNIVARAFFYNRRR